MDKTLKFRHQRSAGDTLECFDSCFFLTMLASRDMANSVSQEAYGRASLAETSSARDQSLPLNLNLDLAVRDRTRSIFQRLCQSVSPLVSCLICRRVQASLYARLVLVEVVWFILER